ncbi:MAG TPA: HEAT repeat domain-containing protein [Polyangiaceae bacterium]|nr:HEAT repeat domain-containing protein [Polyangiaceae bacterium]
MSDARLDALLRSPGYTPSQRDLPALFERLASADDDGAKVVERALSRAGSVAADRACALFDGAEASLRARLCALVGRVAQSNSDPALTEWLVLRLEDGDPRTRRRAASALGKIGNPGVEAALVNALSRARDLAERRALVAAIGKVGGDAGRAALSTLDSRDAELTRIVREATTKLARARARREPSIIALHTPPLEPVTVLLHVRAGLEELLVEELGPARGPSIVGRGRVAVTLREPLGALFSARTFLHIGFPLPPVAASAEGVEGAVVGAITSPLAVTLFTRFTRGPLRYRLSWAEGGRKRARNFRVAAAVSAARPELFNDPTDAPWEVVVTERSGKSGSRIFVELWPRGLADPRFAYRRETLFASSHPTIAAALARTGGVRANDVVWDPFAGSAMELVERALLGRYEKLYGSDSEPAALARAKENLAAAGVERYELLAADARTLRLPVPPTLVVTNPPYGKRVRGEGDVIALLDATLGNIASQLTADGRVVWVTPNPSRTDLAAKRHGLVVSSRRSVDVGGIRAELQILIRAPANRRAPR